MNRHPSKPKFDEEGVCTSAEDWLGNRFEVGERVLYCIGAGSGQMMAYGVVQQIEAKIYDREVRELCNEDAEGAVKRVRPAFETYWGLTPECVFYEHTITKTFTDIRVQVLTEYTSGSYSNDKRTKPAWVNPMNITAIPQDWIPSCRSSPAPHTYTKGGC